MKKIKSRDLFCIAKLKTRSADGTCRRFQFVNFESRNAAHAARRFKSPLFLSTYRRIFRNNDTTADPFPLLPPLPSPRTANRKFLIKSRVLPNDAYRYYGRDKNISPDRINSNSAEVSRLLGISSGTKLNSRVCTGKFIFRHDRRR